MLFMACFTSYMLRVNISINILGMVEPNHLNENKTQPDDLPDVSKSIRIHIRSFRIHSFMRREKKTLAKLA